MNEKSFWSIVARSSCCTQNSKTPISVVWEIQSSNFCCWKFAQRWAIEWWNNYTACTATNVILPFQQGNHFCSSFQSQNDYSVSPTWHQVLQVYLLFTAIHMVHVMTQNMESRKNMVSWKAEKHGKQKKQSQLPATTAALARLNFQTWNKTSTNASIHLELLRVILVLTSSKKMF